MAVQERLYTAQDLLALPHDTKRYVLVEGRLIEMSPTGKMHGRLTSRLTSLLDTFVSAHHLGQVYGAETGFRVSENPDTVYGIDAAFVSKARAQYGDGYFNGAPDLAVEVVSPGNAQVELHQKIRDYFAAGASHVWVVYPRTRVIYQYLSTDQIRVLHEEDVLEVPDLLPGFSLRVGALFSVLDE